MSISRRADARMSIMSISGRAEQSVEKLSLLSLFCIALHFSRVSGPLERTGKVTKVTVFQEQKLRDEQ